ncbi:MAG: pyruvoyl-dependent arginine decarboxylase, partial [bacterium]
VVGKGEGTNELLAFDNALYQAGISQYNLVKVSSILPPFVKKAEKIDLPPGALLPIAYARLLSKIPGEVISAAIAVGIPKDSKNIGVIMEYSGVCSEEEAREIVFRMTVEAMRIREIILEDVEILSISHETKNLAVVFGGCAIW